MFRCLLKSMQPEGHFWAHSPQATQASGFMLILLSENRDMSPRTAPTGQILVQKKRPFSQVNRAIAVRMHIPYRAPPAAVPDTE